MTGDLITASFKKWYRTTCPWWLSIVVVYVLFCSFIVGMALYIKPKYGDMLAHSRLYCVGLILLYMYCVFLYVSDGIKKWKRRNKYHNALAVTIVVLFVYSVIHILQHYYTTFILGV